MFKASVRYFESVVRHGSIRAAAEALHIAQSAVSRQLQALERELDTPLFERRARGIMLTPAGEILHRMVRDATFEIERVRSEIDALQGLRRGHVRLATVESLVNRLVPLAIDRFRARHPGVTFSVFTAGSDQVVQAVKAGDADIGIAFNQPPSSDIRVAFRQREPIYAVMTPDHVLARARRVSIAQLAAWPVGLSQRWSGTRQLVDAASAKSGTPLAPVLETNSIELLLRFALAGVGIAFLPRTTCDESIRARRLVAVPLSDPALSAATLDIMSLAARRLPLAAEAFLDVIRRALREEPDGR